MQRSPEIGMGRLFGVGQSNWARASPGPNPRRDDLIALDQLPPQKCPVVSQAPTWEYAPASMSSTSVGPVGVQPSSSRVAALVADISMLKKVPMNPK